MTNRRALTILELIVLLVALFILAAILVPNFVPQKRSLLGSCRSNLKNLATALEMYASDNGGDFPLQLNELIRKDAYGPYLKTLPTCPAAGRMTYENYQVSQRPQAFSFACCGNNHATVYRDAKGINTDCTNYPRYHSEQGLVEPTR